MRDTEHMSRCDDAGRQRRLIAFAFSLAALLAGLLYYGLVWQQMLPPLLAWLSPYIQLPVLSLPADSWWQSAPSLVHAFATILLMHAVLPAAMRWRNSLRLVMIVALTGFELFFGTTDRVDLLAIGIGVAMAEFMAWRLRLFIYAGVRVRPWALAGLVSASALLAAGTSYGPYYPSECARYDEAGVCEEYKKAASPVYMSYRRLRESVALQPARPPDRIGRLYLYGDYVFLNERNEGLHVIDNTIPEAPVNIGFIRIPGNTEVAIRNNYLYADSYVDLITLDLNDPTNVLLIDRQQDIFPYDAFQNIPYNIKFSTRAIDRQNGVVVGYQLAGD